MPSHPRKRNSSHTDEEIVDLVIRQFGQMQSDRGNLDSHCQEIAERIWPVHSRAFLSKGTPNRTFGEKRTEELFDSSASIALQRFGAILDSLLTPRNQTWHKLIVSNEELAKERNVKLFFDDVTRILFKRRYAPTANFASQNQINYKHLGAYGTGGLFIDQLEKDIGLRYKGIHLSELYIKENHQGLVDQVIRHFPLTARQAKQRWGDNKLSGGIQSALVTNADKEFMFLHCVKPREDIDLDRKDFRSMPFVSYYISMDGRVLMEEGGFEIFPYAVSRYEQFDGPYGISPAMDVLPAIKTLNEQKKTLLKQGHRAVDPVLLVHDDGIIDSFSLRPGALNAGGVSSEGRALVQSLPVGSVAFGIEMMEQEQSLINDAFLISIFQILVETPTMTATEVMERTREKGILLSPTVGRQQSEYLGPMIEREVAVLAQLGLIPKLPDILLEAQGEFEIQYDSPLSRSQRAEEAAGLMRSVETTLQVVNVTQNPAPLDHFNWDIIIPDLSDIHGVPQKWMRSLVEVQQIREGRAEEARQQQEIQGAPGASALINSVAKAQASAQT